MADEKDIPISQYPSDLHPLLWSDFPEDFGADPTVIDLHDAYSDGVQAWRATITGHNATMEDPMSTPDQNLYRAHRAGERRWNEFEGKMTKALIRATDQIKALDAAMNQVPRMPSEHVALHIARQFERMSPDDRTKRVNEAMANKEMDTVGAVLFFSDPALYGFTPERRELFRAKYRTEAFPDHLKRKAALEMAVDIATRGLNGYRRDFAKKYDLKRIEAARKKAEAAKRALGE